MRKSMPVLVLLLLACCLLFPLSALAGSSEISGYAFLDGGSGLYDGSARMQAGVTVSLYSLDDEGEETLIGTVTTGNSGSYAFTGLDAGQYRLRAQAPDNCCFIMPQEGGSVMLPAVGTRSYSQPIRVEDGMLYGNAHIGVSRAFSYVKIVAFEDLNQNGGRSTNETLLRGVQVAILYELDGELIEIASGSTDINGEAIFLHITPGAYRFAATLPAPYIFGPVGEKVSLWYNCVPPSDSNYGMTAPAQVIKGDSLGIGVGAVSTGSLQGSIWSDTNMNGLRDGIFEGGYAGASVHLHSAQAGVDREVVTGEDGQFRFGSLLAGEYLLSVTLPENSMFTLPGGDSLFSEGYSRTDSCLVTVETMMESSVQSIGVIPATSLSVLVYNDLNVNGYMDPGEPPFAGAALNVLDGDEVVAAVLSDGDGVAHIPVLRGGDRELRLMLPDGQVFTVDGLGNDFAAPAATGDLTVPVTLPHGEETQLSAGVTQAASVSGILFDDRDLSGIMEDGEAGLPGFTVQAVNSEGLTVAQTVTDDQGHYTFNNLLPAVHTLRFQLVDAYVCSDYSDSGAAHANSVISQTPEYGETDALILTPGQSLTDVSAAIFRSATISGQVLLDSGVPSMPVEGGMAGVRVTLLDEYGGEVSETTTTYTDENGSFYLKGALPGDYLLEYQLPENACFVHPITTDESYVTDLFTVQVADDLVRAPLYAIQTGSLSGYLYIDGDLNGRFDASETVLPDISIQLTNTDLDQIYETATLDNGQYILDQLRPGAYTIAVTLPEGLCFAYDASSPLPPQVGTAAESAFTLEIGQQMEQRCIAAARPASFTGSIYFDQSYDGLRDVDEPGAAGITVTLQSVDGPQSYSMQTDADGICRLEALVPGADTLRVTLPGDCIPTKGNDAQLTDGFWVSKLMVDNGEEKQDEYGILRYASVGGHIWSLDGTLNGAVGRTVSLYQEGAAEPLAITVSDENGAYAFQQLLPGQYRVACDLPDERYNYARTVDASLRPAYLPGAEPDIPVGFDGYFPVAMGADMQACDIGIGALGELGDTAWLDLNGNGLQDGAEPTLPGIAIQLYQYGALAAETVTDSMGRYLITDLYPGSYTVRVTVPAELKVTVIRADYPLAASVLTEVDAQTAQAMNITVPSAGRNLNCDLGFVLRQEGVYPASLESLSQIDWSFNGQRK